nr:MAG TPA: hypothetical protein [Caudoviricetes sp.]
MSIVYHTVPALSTLSKCRLPAFVFIPQLFSFSS